jgi:hypothetical protein
MSKVYENTDPHEGVDEPLLADGGGYGGLGWRQASLLPAQGSDFFITLCTASYFVT